MADKHPYISGVGNISQSLNHFRNSLPSKIDSVTLKKLGLAPANESFLINVLKFIKLIGEDGTVTKEATNIFSQHNDDDFREQFKVLIEAAYGDLFELYSDKTWELDQDSLITFFRQTDQTSSLIGKHQARTFKVLAATCGYGELPKESKAKKLNTTTPKKKVVNAKPKVQISNPIEDSGQGTGGNDSNDSSVALTVRIEVNLPADGDQKTYDRIFKSIRENLINGN